MATKKKGIVAKSPSRKKIAKKKAVAKKTTGKNPAVHKSSNRQAAASSVGARIRRKIIAETAYFLSLQRRSEESSALEDWLTAEAQVDQKLTNQKD